MAAMNGDATQYQSIRCRSGSDSLLGKMNTNRLITAEALSSRWMGHWDLNDSRWIKIIEGV